MGRNCICLNLFEFHCSGRLGTSIRSAREDESREERLCIGDWERATIFGWAFPMQISL